MQQELRCPTCLQTDQVQKVSGLYNANTKEWVESHQQYDADGQMYTRSEIHKAHTLLGQQLAPPGEPAKPRNPIWVYGILGVIFLIITGIVCSTLGSTLLLPIGLLVFDRSLFPTILPEATTWISSLPDWVGTAGIVLLCLGGLITLVLLVFIIRFARRNFKETDARYQKQKSKWERELLPDWQRSMERWQNMYYCARDETVFVAGEPDSVPVVEAQAFINRYRIT